MPAFEPVSSFPSPSFEAECAFLVTVPFHVSEDQPTEDEAPVAKVVPVSEEELTTRIRQELLEWDSIQEGFNITTVLEENSDKEVGDNVFRVSVSFLSDHRIHASDLLPAIVAKLPSEYIVTEA
jgi:hypothetical protein